MAREAAGEIVHVQAGQLIAPAPLPTWQDGTAAAWYRWWGSDIAKKVVAGVDVSGLVRLFSYYDLMGRMYEEGMSQIDLHPMNLLSIGSKGQETTSAHLDSLQKLEGMAVKLEERFGIT